MDRDVLTLVPPPARPSSDGDVWVFADEAKPDKRCPWLYMGVTLVRECEVPAVVDALQERCGDHDREMHFREITTATKRDVAEEWIELALFDQRIRFAALAVRTDLLQSTAFGAAGPQLQRRIHTRFLRPTIASSAKSFFGAGVRLGSIVHDFADDLDGDLSFKERSPDRIQRLHDIPVVRPSIFLVGSDHTVAGDQWRSARLLQLTDILLGATRQCMEDTSSKTHINRVAARWLPVVERLTDPRRRENRDSRYRHVGRVDVSFFPSCRLEMAELSDPLLRARSKIFRDREPAMSRRGQLRLDSL
ncbi:MAG: hypothetical protein AB7L91_15350 [Dehalococcoidia bacterium]